MGEHNKTSGKPYHAIANCCQQKNWNTKEEKGESIICVLVSKKASTSQDEVMSSSKEITSVALSIV